MIQQKIKICICGCGKSGKIFSKGLILPCWRRLNPPVFKKRIEIKKISDKKRIVRAQEIIETKKLHEWFLKIWDKTEDTNGYCYCFETGAKMHRSIYRTNTCCYHHLLEKGIEKYKLYAMEEWNVVIVLPEIHYQVHHSIHTPPRIKNYTEELKSKY